MKVSLLFLCLSFQLQAQDWCHFNYTYINFDDGYCVENFYIDTVANPANLWRIGTPQKATFLSGNYGPIAIVTDTLSPYPVNNGSSFLIKTLHGQWPNSSPGFVMMEGYYFVDSDSLKDYGTMEYSPDNGVTWIDILNDPEYADDIYWYPQKPVLTGHSGGFKYFECNLINLLPQFNTEYADTVAFRFSFFSDSIPEAKDGLMFDDFYFMQEFIGGTSHYTPSMAVNIFPNPMEQSATLSLHSSPQSPMTLFITDQTGRNLLAVPVDAGNVQLDLQMFPPGLYYCFLKDDLNAVQWHGKLVRI